MYTMIRFTVVSFFVLGIISAGMSAEPEKKEKGSCLLHIDGMKDAKYEVTNIPDGVTIKITSDKPALVEQIQATAAQCREAHASGNHKTGCPMKMNSNSPGSSAESMNHEHDEHHGAEK
jgi:TusA-related sulfurtransferase